MSLYLNSLISRQLGKLSLGKLSLGKLSLGKLSLGKLSLGKLSLGKLSLGLSQTSVRLKSSKKKAKREKKKKEKAEEKQRIEPSFEPGYGERIWIFNHIIDGLTVISGRPVLKANQAMRQIVFTARKLKPSKFRRDLWRPMALLQLPEGYGEVGRTVYHRLRECKTLHELCWKDDALYDRTTGRCLTREERGRRLNDQRANTVADIAAVLGGLGKGNKMRPEILLEDANAGPDQIDAVAGRVGKVARTVDVEDGLLKATVFWANALDQKYAEKWPANVTHATFAESEWQPLEATAAGGKVAKGQEGGDSQESQKAPADLVADEELQKVSEETQKPSP